MKVRLLTSIAGSHVAYDFGQVVEVSPAVGLAWVHEGLATAVDATGVPSPDAAPEAAVTTPPEQAILPRARGRRR